MISIVLVDVSSSTICEDVICCKLLYDGLSMDYYGDRPLWPYPSLAVTMLVFLPLFH